MAGGRGSAGWPGFGGNVAVPVEWPWFGWMTVTKICRKIGISRNTWYKFQSQKRA